MNGGASKRDGVCDVKKTANRGSTRPPASRNRAIEAVAAAPGEEGARRKARPTLSDIAASLGVSEATVSRALRGNPEISEQTRTLIRRVARDLGYVPNAAARSLVRRSSRTLGLLVPDVTDPQHALIVAGFSRASDLRGYTVIVMDGSRDAARRERSLRTLIEHQVDGIAICSTPLALAETIEALRPTHCVFITPEGTDADMASDASLGRLRADDEHGIRMLVEHLLEHGRRRFSYVNGPDIASNRLRRNAILSALESLGIEPRIREFATDPDQTDFSRIAELVDRERPDALICYDDRLALHMLDALRTRNLSVPHDLAVTGFDGISFAAISNPRLTTIVQPAEALGEMAAVSLAEAVEEGRPLPDLTLEVTLAVRESSSPRGAAGDTAG